MDTQRPSPPLAHRKHSRWDRETLVCAFRGHVAPGVPARDWPAASPIVAPCGDRRCARCLRCDAWIAADPAWATLDALPDAADIALPRRGAAECLAAVIDALPHALALLLEAPTSH